MDFAKKEIRSPEFIKLNPNKQVPVMDDGGFILYESHAIMKYLFRTKYVQSHWYPKDAKK